MPVYYGGSAPPIGLTALCTVHHFHDGVCCNCGLASKRARPLGAQGLKPRTQKALGVQGLKSIGFSVPDARLVQSPDDLDALLDEPLVAKFVRPCPLTPRPGFVDSRVCKTPDEYRQVWREARAADGKAELMVMPFQDARWNVVLCPGLLTIGPKHDGATAGKGAIGIPLLGEDPVLAKHHDKLAIAPGCVPHVEAVLIPNSWDSTLFTTIFTQARSGPPHPGTGPDYIPQDIVVTGIVEPCEDFLEWEALVKAGFPAGTVVWGNGHTLGSHAALHCLAHGVPFMTSRKPLVGETIPATPELPPYDWASLVDGLTLGLASQLLSPHPSNGSTSWIKYNGHGDILTVLYALHNAPALRGESTWWIGLAAGLLLRYGLHACDVELNIQHIGYSAMSSYQGKDAGPLSPHYTAQWLIDQVQVCIRHFFTEGNTGGIGGTKWAYCAQTLLPLARAIQAALNPPVENGEVTEWQAHTTEHLVQSLIIALNEAINQAHNGGFWMNKYGSGEQEFLEACKGSWKVWADAASALYRWHETRQKADPGKQLARQAEWAGVQIPHHVKYQIHNLHVVGRSLCGAWAHGQAFVVGIHSPVPTAPLVQQQEDTENGTYVRVLAADNLLHQWLFPAHRPASDPIVQKAIAAKKEAVTSNKPHPLPGGEETSHE